MFSQNYSLPQNGIEIYWVKKHVLHEKFTHALIAFVHTAIRLN